MAQTFQNIGIIGGGAWGTALAISMQRAGRKVLLWVREPELIAAINTKHENNFFLPGVALDPAIKATNNLAELSTCDVLLLAVPAQYTRTTAKQLAAIAGMKAKPIVLCAKGIEQNTAKLLSEITAEEIPGSPLAVLSGPSFAVEVAAGKPTALTLATRDRNLGEALVQTIGTRTLRPYLSDDLIGAQIGGAVKNVLAVACGIASGCHMGENARAALITRGLVELTRLGAAMGAKIETLMGLSGLGDLVLTCSSAQSRNMSLGIALGEGTILSDILAKRRSVTEGVFSAAAAKVLAQKYYVEMPIVAAVDAVLNHGAAIEDTIEALLARPFKME